MRIAQKLLRGAPPRQYIRTQTTDTAKPYSAAMIKYFFSPSFLLIAALKTMPIILDTAEVMPIAQLMPAPYSLPMPRKVRSTPSLIKI